MHFNLLHLECEAPGHTADGSSISRVHGAGLSAPQPHDQAMDLWVGFVLSGGYALNVSTLKLYLVLVIA